MFTFVYIVFFLLPTTIHMNVPYYLTIEKGLVHFGSEVRKISYNLFPKWILALTTFKHFNTNFAAL